MEKDKSKFNESKCNFILKYGGKDEIDAETLSLSLTFLTLILYFKEL